MPVNKDPNKRRRLQQAAPKPTAEEQDSPHFGEETEQDREKDAAEAEWKNLWDATEVIDMDKW